MYRNEILYRISDYKHHPMDVLGGLVLGFFLATITHTLAKDVFRCSPRTLYYTLVSDFSSITKYIH